MFPIGLHHAVVGNGSAYFNGASERVRTARIVNKKHELEYDTTSVP